MVANSGPTPSSLARFGSAPREESHRQVVLAVDDRDDHRRRSVAFGRQVDVQTCVEERARHVGEPVARRVMQRRESALSADVIDVRRRSRTASASPASEPRRPVRSVRRGRSAALAGARRPGRRIVDIDIRIDRASEHRRNDAVAGLPRLIVRDSARLVVDHHRGNAGVGAPREQHLHGLEPTLRGGEDERRPAMRPVAAVDVGAAIQQRRDRRRRRRPVPPDGAAARLLP